VARRGDTITVTGSAANALFHAMADAARAEIERKRARRVARMAANVGALATAYRPEVP